LPNDLKAGKWGLLNNVVLKHARIVLREAREQRQKGISPLYFSKKLKAMWEKSLFGEISKIFGRSFAMLGKDLGLLGEKDPRWLALVDLFDGSTNFLFDLKYYSYNLAVAKEHRLVFGICIDLENFDVYSASEGKEPI